MEHTINIEELVQDDHNLNKGTKEGQRLMERSFREPGAGRSILVDRDGRIIAGNKSQLAAMAAGIKRVRVIETEGDELIAVKRTDLSLDSKEGRELAYADNLTTQVNLAWDEIELDHLQTEVEGFDTSDWGFDAKQLAGFEPLKPMEAEIEEPKTEAMDDDFDEDAAVVEPRTKLGDIWKLGNHRLMCGDSCVVEQVQKLMGGELADLWLTDPPYNVALGYEDSASEARQRHRKTDQKIVLNDSMPDKEFRQFLVNAYTAAKEALKQGACYYIFHAYNESYNFQGALRDVGGMQLRETLIWVKDTLTLGRQDYQWRHEPCLYGWKEGASHNWYSDRKQTTCLEFPRPKASKEHPTMKPVPLFAYLMQNSTHAKDIVLDTFGGSGTTLIAAEQLGRCARLMELSPHYCDVIIARWEALTGLKSELL